MNDYELRAKIIDTLNKKNDVLNAMITNTIRMNLLCKRLINLDISNLRTWYDEMAECLTNMGNNAMVLGNLGSLESRLLLEYFQKDEEATQ